MTTPKIEKKRTVSSAHRDVLDLRYPKNGIKCDFWDNGNFKQLGLNFFLNHFFFQNKKKEFKKEFFRPHWVKRGLYTISPKMV